MSKIIDGKFVAEENVLYENQQPLDDLGNAILVHGYELAIIESKRILGTTRYDEIIALGASSAFYQTLKSVVARIALYYSFNRLNLRVTRKGGFVRSSGMVENTLDIMSYRESIGYRNQILKEGHILLSTLHTSTGLQPYGTSPGNDTVYTL